MLAILVIRAADEETRTKADVKDELCLAAFYKNRLLGWVCYEIEEDDVALFKLDASDDTIADGLVRAALNDARRKGAVTANSNHDDISKLLNGTEIDIFDFFNNTPCCK